MVASEKKDRMGQVQKTRGQLRRELDEAQRVIREKEAELAAVQKSLAEALARVAQLEDSFAPTSAHPKDKDSVKLAQEIDELRLVNHKIKGECEALKKRLLETEERAQKHAEAVKREQRESERQRRNYESQVKEMERKLSNSKDHATNPAQEPVLDEVEASRAAFRIFLHARQEGFQGRIEHTLTQDKRIFNGLDQTAIMGFIGNHLPRWENGTEEARTIPPLEVHAPVTSTSAGAEAAIIASPLPSRSVELGMQHEPMGVPVPPQLSAPRNGSPRLVEMKMISKGSAGESKVILRDEPFAVELTLDFSEAVDPASLPLDCKVLVSAKRLEGGSLQVLGKSTKSFTRLIETVHVPAIPLAPGLYRLQAKVDVGPSVKHNVPGSVFLFEKRLIVC